ncbi:MAG: ATP-binding cassette domain-containing protein, partial [Janthinobacterium lividum]
LTLGLPDGARLIENAALRIRRGEWTVISGPSGSGKSSLFRALAGIWPFASGRVRRPAGRAMFLPQRPYVPLGTLRHALAYPAGPAAHPDAAMRAVLADIGLGAMAGSLDTDANWSQRLSGGEQQRLAMGRVLLARPDWLFLDEATASLDPAAEAALHAVLRQRLPDMTVVSIAHHAAVGALHERRIRFERQPGTVGRLEEEGDVPLPG